jgi:hypothetical protein
LFAGCSAFAAGRRAKSALLLAHATWKAVMPTNPSEAKAVRF